MSSNCKNYNIVYSIKKNDVTQPLYYISNCTAISCNNGIEHKVECRRQMKMCY